VDWVGGFGNEFQVYAVRDRVQDLKTPTVWVKNWTLSDTAVVRGLWRISRRLGVAVLPVWCVRQHRPGDRHHEHMRTRASFVFPIKVLGSSLGKTECARDDGVIIQPPLKRLCVTGNRNDAFVCLWRLVKKDRSVPGQLRSLTLNPKRGCWRGSRDSESGADLKGVGGHQ